jgi:hypothetical protein
MTSLAAERDPGGPRVLEPGNATEGKAG